MRININTRIVGTNVILVPYQEKHVSQLVNLFFILAIRLINKTEISKGILHRYHEWMICPTLQYLTGSEPLTLEEEFEMQKRWLEDEDSKYSLITH